MKTPFLFVFSLLLGLSGLSQNNYGSADDLNGIAITPVVVSNTNIPSYAKAIVENKLKQIVSQNGLGEDNQNARFIITANIVELSRETTPTAPPMIALSLSPSLYIGDVKTGVLFASCTLANLSGVGTNETKAYSSALKQLQTNNDEVKAFVVLGKQKIIEYYNSQVDLLLAQADALAKGDQYDEAIIALMEIPSACKNAYTRAMDKVAEICQKKIDKESKELLNTATVIWNANQTLEGANEAAEYLFKVHPLSSSAKAAESLSNTIAKRVVQLDAREWKFKMQQYKDNYELKRQQMSDNYCLRSQMIDAARDIYVAQAKRPVVNNYYSVHWW